MSQLAVLILKDLTEPIGYIPEEMAEKAGHMCAYRFLFQRMSGAYAIGDPARPLPVG